ncbi:DUF2974 domain-containing protein [Synechococcus sp. CBW1004]|nr:DUF2974 domain-containing protein [Synechococcus sp. CBW1004]
MTTEATVLLQAAFSSYPDSTPPAGYLRDKEVLSSPSGLHMEIYRRTGSRDYIISFRGTETTKLNDLSADANLGWPQYASAQRDIQRILELLIEEGGRVEITGHSLGGALAQFSAYDFIKSADSEEKRSQILSQLSLTTWNALGAVWGLQRNGGYDPTIMEGFQARHYFREDDLVARFGKGHVGGEMLRLDDPEGKIMGVLAAHMQEELTESLLAGTISKASPNYLDLYDTSQMVAGELAMGLLRLLKEGETLAGAMQIMAASLTLPMGSALFLAEDLGQILGEVYMQAGPVILRDQGPRLAAAIWELGRRLGEAWIEATELQKWSLQQQMLFSVEAITGNNLGNFSLPGRPSLAGYETTLTTHLQPLNPIFRCPLVLDLAGDGLATLSLSSSGVRFDLDGDGTSEACGWIADTEALLVRDLNGNGRIDSGLELFGDHTLLRNGERAEHGFAALADLDSHRDGQIDARDAAWGELGLWRDRNSNGSLDDGEWLSLSSQNITSLELEFSAGSGLDAQGNDLRLAGHFRRQDGSRHLLADIWLATAPAPTTALAEVSPVSSSNSDSAPAPHNLSSRWPDIGGMGRVPGLQEALNADSSGHLQELLHRWQLADGSERPALLADIAFSWAGITDPPSPSGSLLLDARIPAALHAFSNDRFLNAAWDLNNETTVTVLRGSFQALCRQIGTLLEAELLLSPLWSRSIRIDAEGQPQLDPERFALALEDQLNRSRSDEQLMAASRALRSHVLVSQVLTQGLRAHALDNLHQPDRRLWLLLLPARQTTASPQTWIWNQAEDELIEAGSDGSATISGGGGADVLLGSERPDTLLSDGGNDLILASGGDDLISTSAAAGHTTIVGGSGNDSLSLQHGTNTLIHHLGDGYDTLIGNSNQARNELLLGPGISAADIRLVRSETDLSLEFGPAGNGIRLPNQFRHRDS